MAKVLVVGLNPAWQITLEFARFHWGQLNRAESRHEFVAGKGQNVAKVLSRFGHQAWLLQVIGGANGLRVEEGLCREGVLKPHARHLMLKPHVRLWNAAGAKSRASGHVELEGFLPNSVLRLAGYQLRTGETLSEEEEKKQVLGTIELSLIKFLRETFPECQVTVSPATVLRNA